MKINEIKEKFMNDIVEITLKDGNNLKGRIIDIFPNGHIRFSTKKGTYYIPIEKVEKIKICDFPLNDSTQLFKDEENCF